MCPDCLEDEPLCTCEWSDEDRFDDDGIGCYNCNEGWLVVCPDDLCHGKDECIHGYPPVPCSVCNPKGWVP